MNILVLLPFAFYRQSGSALSSYYRILALSELGHEILVIAYPHGEDTSIKNVKIKRCLKNRVFKSYEPGEWKKKLVYDFFILQKALKQIFLNHYDIVICHGTLIIWGIVLRPFTRAKFIANLHSTLSNEFSKWGVSKSGLLQRIVHIFEIIALKGYTKIITVSQSLKEWLIDSGVEEQNISTINNSVFSQEIISPILPTNPFTVLYTGTFVNIQNLKLVYDVAKLLKNCEIEFIFVGATDQEYNTEIEKAKGLGIIDICSFYKREVHADMIKFYDKATVVISPRTYGIEIPMKLYDYMNFGKCILATKMPVHQNILNSEIAVLVPPTPEDFAKKILFLKNNTQFIFDTGIRAKEYFEKNFGFENMKKKYLALLDSL